MKHLLTVSVRILLCLFLTIESNSQNPTSGSASASGAAMAKGEDAKFNHSNGNANIGIPLFEIDENGAKFPISINHQTGGLKVEELSSKIGMGWSLNAGGSIMREVKGLPDDYDNNGQKGFFYLMCNKEEVDNDAPTDLDQESDIYVYNFMGYTGKFFFEESGEIIQINNSDVKIESINELCEEMVIYEWKITLPDGTYGVFSSRMLFENPIYNFHITSQVTIKQKDEDDFTYTNEWRLLGVHFNNGEVINLDYSINNYKDVRIGNRTFYVDHNNKYLTNNAWNFTSEKDLQKVFQIEFTLTSIISDHYRIEFLTEDREDLYDVDELIPILGVLLPLNIFPDPVCYSGLNIFIKKDGVESCFKTIDFKQSYVNSSDEGLPSFATWGDYTVDRKRLKLDHVNFGNCNNEDFFAIDLEYNNEDSIPRRLSLGRDYWGFINGEKNNKTLIPDLKFISDHYPSLEVLTSNKNNREVNFSSMLAGSLKKITYPNGYFNEFKYESHDVYDRELMTKEVTEGVTNGLTTTFNDISLISDDVRFMLDVGQAQILSFTIEVLDLNGNSIHNEFVDYDLVLYKRDLMQRFNLEETGTYRIVITDNSWEGNSFIGASFSKLVFVNKEKLIGGLRIKSFDTPFKSTCYDYTLKEEGDKNPIFEGSSHYLKLCNDCPEPPGFTGGCGGCGTYCSNNQSDDESGVFIPGNTERISASIRLKPFCDGEDYVLLLLRLISEDGNSSLNKHVELSKNDPYYDDLNGLYKYVELFNINNNPGVLALGQNYTMSIEVTSATHKDVTVNCTYKIHPLESDFGNTEDVAIGKSSGLLMQLPSFLSFYKIDTNPYSGNSSCVHLLDNDGDTKEYFGNIYQIHTAPTSYLSTNTGGHIIYENVTEEIDGKFGRTLNKFFVTRNNFPNSFVQNKLSKFMGVMGFSPTVGEYFLDPIVGLPSSQIGFDESGSEVTRTTNEYIVGQTNNFIFTRYQTQLACTDDEDVFVPFFKKKNYRRRTSFVYLSKSIGISDGISLIKEYKYRDDFKHHNPIEVISSSSANIEIRSVKTYYPHDLNNGQFGITTDLNALIDKNIIGLTLVTTNHNALLGGSKSNYEIIDLTPPNAEVPLFILRGIDSSSAYNDGGLISWNIESKISSWFDGKLPSTIEKRGHKLATKFLYKDDLIMSRTYGKRFTNYTYDGLRRKTSMINHEGLEMTFDLYDDFHRVKETTSKNGRIKTNFKYSTNKEIGKDEVVVKTMTFPNDSFGLGERVVETFYDERGLVNKTEELNYLQSGGVKHQNNFYNELGKLTVACNNQGCVSNIYSDDVRQRLTASRSSGSSEFKKFSYTTGNPNSESSELFLKLGVTDENGKTSFSYKDVLGRKRYMVNALGFITESIYNDKDELVMVLPPGSTVNDEEIIFQYTYTPDGKLKTKRVPSRNVETNYYHGESNDDILSDGKAYEYLIRKSLHNGDSLTYNFHENYLDFLKEVKLNDEVIKIFEPFNNDYALARSGSTKLKVIGEDNFLESNNIAFDDLGRVLQSTVEFADETTSTYTKEYDALDNSRSTTIKNVNDAFNQEEYFVTENMKYDKGLRLTDIDGIYPFNGEQKEFKVAHYDYNNRDLIAKTQVNKAFTTHFKYHSRGSIKQINTIESVYSTIEEDPCDDTDGTEEYPIPGCEESLLSEVIIYYDCVTLAEGKPTTVVINFVTYDVNDPNLLSDQIFYFGINGGPDYIDDFSILPNSESFEFDTNSSTGYLGSWLVSILESCMGPTSTNGGGILTQGFSQANQMQLDNIIYLFGGENSDENPNDPDYPGPGGEYIGKQLFGLELYYEEGNEELNAKGQKNGSVSWMEWQVSNEAYQAYGYEYDDIYRLTAANFNVDPEIVKCSEIPRNAYSTNYKYDERGNITFIKRNGLKGYESDGVTPSYSVIDLVDLKYAHKSNLLEGVSDNIDTENGYKINGGGSGYNYVNGNQVSDNNIVNTDYNYLDLPTKIVSTKGTIYISYDADGNKLAQDDVPNDGEAIQRFYKDGFEYENFIRKNFYHSEGRIMYNAEMETEEGTVTKDFVEWNIVDHLGNTRIRYIDKNENDVIDLDDEDLARNELSGSYHYYPFGMLMEGNFTKHQGAKEKYQYNGIEQCSVLGIDIGLTHYRVHDAALCKWWQVDPKSEEAYSDTPFNSMFNNPVSMSDPNGDFAILMSMLMGALYHTGGHILSNGFNFENWNWGAFAGSIVGSAVGGQVGSVLKTKGIGGFYKGAISGASSSLASGITSGLINNDLSLKSIATSTLQGGVTSGLKQGFIDLYNGKNFFNGSRDIGFSESFQHFGMENSENMAFVNKKLFNEQGRSFIMSDAKGLNGINSIKNIDLIKSINSNESWNIESVSNSNLTGFSSKSTFESGSLLDNKSTYGNIVPDRLIRHSIPTKSFINRTVTRINGAVKSKSVVGNLLE